MNMVERINEDLEKLPLTLQSEVFNFVEYLLFKNERQSIPKESVIQCTPAVCFGKPRIRHTRIPVWLLASVRWVEERNPPFPFFPVITIDRES